MIRWLHLRANSAVSDGLLSHGICRVASLERKALSLTRPSAGPRVPSRVRVNGGADDNAQTRGSGRQDRMVPLLVPASRIRRRWVRATSDTTECDCGQNGRIMSQSEDVDLSLIHISEPTRRTPISYAVFC